jgi:gliding motility-associated lipoprotein GldH
MKAMHNISLFLFLAVAMVFTSCDPNRVYETNRTVDGEKWHKDSALTFPFTIEDTLSSHNLLINIRNSGSYRYRNLLLYIDLQLPGEQTIVDTLNCILADEKGKWYGKGWGSIWSSTIPYKSRIRFPNKGEYRLTLIHAMRDENLRAISDIGVRIEKAR